MPKRILFLAVLTGLLGMALPRTVSADRAVVGRITNVTPTSISVLDHEHVTFTLDRRTHYTKWITQKSWQQDTRLTGTVLVNGQLVAVHPRHGDRTVASWVQIATDMPMR